MKFKFFNKKACPQKPVASEQSADKLGDFEICIHCGKQTSVLRSTPIELRKGFIAGCGQLCSDCTRAMELETHNPDFRTSNREMQALLSVCSEDEQ